MIRKDIQVFHRGKAIIVQSNKHFFSFSRNRTGIIEAFCTADLTPDMIMDIVHSGIVNIISCENGNIILSPKFGYDILKMQDVIVAIFEKFDL